MLSVESCTHTHTHTHIHAVRLRSDASRGVTCTVWDGRGRGVSQIHIDVVSMGENNSNEAKLQSFVDTVNKDGNQSHYVSVPAGMFPADVLRASPLIQGEGGATVSHFQEFGGFDPTLDPEMAAVRQFSGWRAASGSCL